VRQLAAAFENSLIGMFFKRSLKSGSEQPHISERLRLQKNYAALGETGAPRDGMEAKTMRHLPSQRFADGRTRAVN